MLGIGWRFVRGCASFCVYFVLGLLLGAFCVFGKTGG